MSDFKNRPFAKYAGRNKQRIHAVQYLRTTTQCIFIITEYMTEFVIHTNPSKPSILKAGIELFCQDDQKAEVSQTEKLVFLRPFRAGSNIEQVRFILGILIYSVIISAV